MFVCLGFYAISPIFQLFNYFLYIYSFQHTEEKSFRKTLWKKVKLLKMSNFTFFHNVFYAICIFKSFNSHISDVACGYFEFGTDSKLCIREWVNDSSQIHVSWTIFNQYLTCHHPDTGRSVVLLFP